MSGNRALGEAGADQLSIKLAQNRYISDILRQERFLSISRIVAQPSPNDYLTLIQDEKLMTIAVRDDQLALRYRLTVSAFRLSQYLELGWIDREAVFRDGLYHEPDCGAIPDNSIHVITIERQTGSIVGYVALFGQRLQSVDQLVTEPMRDLFPCEEVHRLRVFDCLPDIESDTRLRHVWEVKRLVQRASNASNRHLQIATMLHQFRGIFSTLDRLGDAPRWLIGDAQEHVAIKQLRMTVRDLTVFEGTVPRMSAGNLYWPAYSVRKNVKPFAARVPKGAAMQNLLEDLATAMVTPDLLMKLKILKERTIEDVRRVHL